MAYYRKIMGAVNLKSWVLLMVLFSVAVASALPIYVSPLDGENLQPGVTFNYVFNFTIAGDCSGVLLSNSSNITTKANGVGFIDIDISSLATKPNYLCEYRDGSLRKVHSFSDMILEDVWAENLEVESSGFFQFLGSLINRVSKIWASELDVSGNVTAGFFIGDGSGLSNLNLTGVDTSNLDANTLNGLDSTTFYNASNPAGYITSADVVTVSDVWVNSSGDNMTGILSMGGNKITGLANGTDPQDAVTFGQLQSVNVGQSNDSNLLGGYDASFFMPLNKSVSGDFDFNGGWAAGGLSIIDGDIFAQTAYLYNITSLGVNTLSVNGSILPPVGFSNVFDIGSSSLRWKDLFLGGELSVDGTGDSYVMGNFGIGTTNPDTPIHIKGGYPTFTLQRDYSGPAASAPAIRFGSTNSAGDSTDVVGLQGVTESYTAGSETGYFSIRIKNAGSLTERMRITSTGDVGIGDTTPDGTLKLDVEGQVGATAYCDENGANCMDISVIANGSSKWGDNGSDIYYNGGNVGIGTSSPDVDLVVERTGSSAQIKVETISSGTASLRLVDATGGNILFRADGGDSYINSGNVGIGTSGPGAKLEIESTASTGLYIDSNYGSDHWLFRADTNGVNPSGLWETGDNIRLLLRDNAGNIDVDLRPDGDSYVMGDFGVGTTIPSGTLKLDVEGQVGATAYCDENGANCVDIAAVASGSYLPLSGGTLSGTLNLPIIRLTDTTDASLSSTNHAFQSGLTSSVNIIMDNNEIMARSNGAVSALHFNPDGADVTINNNAGGGKVWHIGNDGAGSLLDADLLDGVSSARFSQFDTDTQTSGSAASGWVTVAISSGTRGYSEVYVWDTESSDHSFIHLDWMRSYAGTSVTVIGAGGHTRRLTGVRVIRTSDTTYGQKKLQIYVTVTSNYNVRLKDKNAISGFTSISAYTPTLENLPVGWVVQNSEITGMTADGGYLATTGGIISGGAITATTIDTGSGAKELGDAAVANGDTNSIPTSDQVYDFVVGQGYGNDQTAAEILTLIKTVDGPGSGLDADTLDTISSASFLRSDTANTATGLITFNTAGTTATRINIDAEVNQWKYTRLSTGGLTKWDIATNEGDQAGALQFRPAGSSTNAVLISTSGVVSAYNGFKGNSVANIGGTGDAAYFPEGIYSAKYNWLYGGINMGGSALVSVSDATLSGKIMRSSHSSGFLEGSYNNVGANTAKSNPIYTIGSSYNPTDTTIGNMYGIGYSNAAWWNGILGEGESDAGWGMYVASDGNVRVTLSGQNGDIWSARDITAVGAVAGATINTGNGAKELGDAAVANGDTNSIPTGDQVYDFVIARGYTNDQTAAEILTAIKTVDGSTSGLDADLLDGYTTTASANRWGVIPSISSTGVLEAGKYIDFQETDTTTGDYASRLTSTGGVIYTSGSFYVDSTLYIGSGDTLLYRDSPNRIATPDSFYVQATSPATYLYSANTYLGGDSGDSTHLRSSTIDGNSWSLTGAGTLTANYVSVITTSTLGISGSSSAAFGRGVQGAGTGGASTGVYGSSTSSTGRGVSGYTSSTTGINYGVLGTSLSSSGRGVYGVASSLSGLTYGVYGFSSSSSTSSYGVYCSAVSGKCGGNKAWSGTSDGRYKDNVTTIPNALEKIKSLRGVNFDWNNLSNATGYEMGFIAQEAVEIVPELIGQDENGYYSMKYAPMTALLTEAMKEQQVMIEDLEVENSELRLRLESIEEYLNISGE